MLLGRRIWNMAGMLLCVMVLCTVWAGAAEHVKILEPGVSLTQEVTPSVGVQALLAEEGQQTTLDGVRYQIDGETASVVGYSVDIPSTCVIPAHIQVDGTSYTVTAIADSGLYNCAQIQSLQLPETLERIEPNAFSGCVGLQEITIPASVSEIGSMAFLDCTALAEISVEADNPFYSSRDGVLFDSTGATLICYPAGNPAQSYTVPDGTDTVDSYSFYQASYLKSVVLPDTVTSINGHAFSYCSALERIDLGDGLRSVGGSAFDWCTSLQTLSFPATLTQLDGSNFHDLSSLTAYEVAEGCENYYAESGVLFARLAGDGVQLWGYPAAREETAYMIPAQVTELGSMSLMFAEHLEQVTFAEDGRLTEIQSGAFTGCSSLKELSIPDTVTHLGSYAFQNCTGLERVALGNGITQLQSGLFHNCGRLTGLTIPANVTYIAETAFRECTSIAQFQVAEGNSAFYDADGVLYSLGEPQRLVAYPAGRNESSLTIPAGVAEISAGCLSASKALCEIQVEAGSQWFYAVDGVLFQRGDTGDSLHTYPSGKIGTSYTVPDGVTSIGNMAFYQNSQLETVDVNDVASIGVSAFESAALKEIQLPHVKEFGDFALLGNNGLKYVVFSAELEQLGGQILDFCDSLEYIQFQAATPPEGYSDLCYESTHLRYVYVPQGSQDTYARFFANGIYPGAMIVEGTYKPTETVQDLIQDLDDSSDTASIYAAAVAVVRLTHEDAEKLSNEELLKVDNLLQKASPSLQVNVHSGVTETAVEVEGTALASGLVEEEKDGSISGLVDVSVTENKPEPDELLSLAFDMTVNGQDRQLQAPVVVTVALTQEMTQAASQNQLSLIHRDDSLEEEPVNFVVENGNATFRAASFSSYIFRLESQASEDVTEVSYSTDVSATVYLAGYDATGTQLLSIQGNPVSAGSGSISFQLAEGVTFKAFLLDEQQRPVGTVRVEE